MLKGAYRAHKRCKDGKKEVRAYNSNIFKANREFGGTGGKLFPNFARNKFTLGDKLTGIILGHNLFQDFVSEGRQNTVCVVDAKALVNLW